MKLQLKIVGTEKKWVLINIYLLVLLIKWWLYILFSVDIAGIFTILHEKFSAINKTRLYLQPTHESNQKLDMYSLLIEPNPCGFFFFASPAVFLDRLYSTKRLDVGWKLSGRFVSSSEFFTSQNYWEQQEYHFSLRWFPAFKKSRPIALNSSGTFVFGMNSSYLVLKGRGRSFDTGCFSGSRLCQTEWAAKGWNRRGSWQLSPSLKHRVNRKKKRKPFTLLANFHITLFVAAHRECSSRGSCKQTATWPVFQQIIRLLFSLWRFQNRHTRVCKKKHAQKSRKETKAR